MNPKAIFARVLITAFAFGVISFPTAASAVESSPEIRTPPAPPTPRINGPAITGVRPGHPYFYHIPASGERPMEFSADDLPTGLAIDSNTGDITGTILKEGEYKLTLHAKNHLGTSARKFRIVVGETIALTPPMGWNSWNHYRDRVSQEIVLQNARAMVDSGLIHHGWTYINIDDTWQGGRGGPLNAIQGNEKFPDMGKLCADVHALGLKIGIYSTPWTTSYAGLIGGSSENPEGTWSKPTGEPVKKWKKIMPYAIGKYSFAKNDAQQWAAWGIDYLKYDWKPNEYPETKEMADALRASGRDIVFSLSNNMDIKKGSTIGKIANCWRTTNDIKANWQSMSERGFGQDRWRAFSGPGHWNDPDMLEIGTKEQGEPGLTPDEEYTHMTLWSLVCAPLLLGADMATLSPFTLNLLTNDEVLAVNQDALGDQAVAVSKDGDMRVYAKKLEGGSMAVGLFNLSGKDSGTVTVKWSDLNVNGSRSVRDLWRQKDLGAFNDRFSMSVAPHGAELVKISR